MIQKIFRSIVAPPICGVCYRFSFDAICHTCFSNLRFIKSPKCLKCSRPFRNLNSPNDTYCSTCITEKFYFDSNQSLLELNATSKKIVTNFKYHGQFFFLDWLSSWLKNQSSLSFPPDCVITYVPLTHKKYISRGFNQSALLALCASEIYGIATCDETLKKIKETPPQAQSTQTQRRTNLSGTFSVKKNRWSGKKVLLVDDVFTTGSTVNECARVLKKQGGAEKVYVLTFIRGV